MVFLMAPKRAVLDGPVWIQRLRWGCLIPEVSTCLPSLCLVSDACCSLRQQKPGIEHSLPGFYNVPPQSHSFSAPIKNSSDKQSHLDFCCDLESKEDLTAGPSSYTAVD